uniref:Uncharacterized protein n=1 Tax=Arundo donax TaxID=35708 RepID=A0A0A8YGN4_ARUDO
MYFCLRNLIYEGLKVGVPIVSTKKLSLKWTTN